MRRLTFALLILLLILASLASPRFIGSALAANKFPAITPGMTRAQVDRHLRAFTKFPNASYNAMSPGESATSYQFLGLGKKAEIKVIYKPNGTVDFAIPSFSN
jgi:hypothetical protein